MDLPFIHSNSWDSFGGGLGLVFGEEASCALRTCRAGRCLACLRLGAWSLLGVFVVGKAERGLLGVEVLLSE